MKKHFLLSIICLISSLFGSVELKWAVETSRLEPVSFDAVHGETLALEAAFKSYGKPLDLTGKAFEIFYQTNKMNSSWWRAGASVSSNTVTALFTPEMDPGVSVVHGFLGSTGDIYRASFTIRFRNGPGAKPNEIPFPVKTLDLATVELKNFEVVLTNYFSDVRKIDDLTVKGTVAYYCEEDSQMYIYEPNWGRYGRYVAPSGRFISLAIPIWDDTMNKQVDAWAIFDGDMPISQVNDIGLNDPLCAVITFPNGETFTRTNIIDRIALESNFTNYYNRAEVDSMIVSGGSGGIVVEKDPTVPDWAKSATKPTYTPEEVGAYPEKSGTQLEAQVVAIGAHLNTEDAKFIVTNYNSSTTIPAAHVQIRQKNSQTDEFEWLHIWNEMTRWNKFTGPNFDWDKWPGFDSWRTNIEDQISARAVKEYAFYDGVTGDVAPDGYFWIGQPKIAICAGASYQRYVNGKNAIWILESNGMIADINGTTNGYFRITDAEGKTHFEIVKGDKRTVYAKQYAFRSETIMGVPHYFTTYAITNAVSSPIAHVSVEGLVPGAFVPENDPNCAANIKWSSVPGGYTLEWWPKADYPSMFVYADYEIGGETYIRNTAPVAMQTIVIDGKKYKIGVSTVSGTKVLSLTEVE